MSFLSRKKIIMPVTKAAAVFIKILDTGQEIRLFLTLLKDDICLIV